MGYPAKEKADAPRLIHQFYLEEASKLEESFDFVHFHSDSAPEFVEGENKRHVK